MRLINMREECLCAAMWFGPENGTTNAVICTSRPVPQRDLYPHEMNNRWIFRRMSAGIQNAGNTCFLASTIQCLWHVPAWLNYLLEDHGILCMEEPHDCVVCKLQRLASASFRSDASSVWPNEISRNIDSIAKTMKPGQQEDAQEFLICLFDKIQKNLTAKMGKLDPMSEMTTALGKIFGGHLKSRLLCYGCFGVSISYEQFFSVSLDIDRASSIEEALENFVAPENMNYDRWYSCSRCSKVCQAEKKYTIDSLPNVFIIHLKRYSYEGAWATKDCKFIKFEEGIDVKPYVSQDLRNQNCSYALRGVTVHLGRTLTSGHYYSYVSSPFDGSWHCMNDSLVTESSWSEVSTDQAYILYYVRRG